MKKILLYLLLIISGAVSAQLPTVPGFVNRNTKEQVISLMAHDQLSPPADTIYTKLGFAIRAGVAYYGNGTYWTSLASGSAYVNPLTTLGDIIYGGVSGVQTRLGGNITAVPQTLRSTGTGSAATAPTWNDASLYVPNGELAGDQIVALGNGRDFTNAHTVNTLQNGIVSGGIVTWTGSGLIFNVSPTVYVINGVQYSYPGGTVTLSAADPSDPRFSAIVVTTSSTATSIDGSAQTNPEVPTADPSTELFLTSIFVDAGATTPTTVGTVIVRDEGSGGEWTISKTLTSTDNYGTNPFHGSISQRITGANSGQYMQWIAPSLQSKALYNTLLLYIRNNSAFASVRNLTVTLRNTNATQVGNAINLTTYGYVKSATGSYQTIAIPMSAFQGADGFDRIRITNTQVGGTVDVQIDYVQLQSGIVQPPVSSGVQEHYGELDSTYTIDRKNLFNGFSHRLFGIGKYVLTANTGSSTDSFFVLRKSDGSNLMYGSTVDNSMHMSQLFIGPNLFGSATSFNVLNGAVLNLATGGYMQSQQQALRIKRYSPTAGSDPGLGVIIYNDTLGTMGVNDSTVYKPLSIRFVNSTNGVESDKVIFFGDGHIEMLNGPTLSGTPTGGIFLGAVGGELTVMDASNNTTTLSPHNFSGIPEGPSDPLAWAYYSERNGKYINVDMYKLAELVEKLTGEKLIYKGYIKDKIK